MRAVAEPDMGDLHRRRHPVQDDDLVAPVDLVGLARREDQRNIGISRRAAARLLPGLRMPPDRTVAALIAKVAKLLENPRQRQPFPRRLARIGRQKPLQLVAPGTHPRQRLVLAFIAEFRLPRTQDLAHHFARDLQLAADLLDRLPLNQRKAAYLCNRLHDQHPKQCLR